MVGAYEYDRRVRSVEKKLDGFRIGSRDPARWQNDFFAIRRASFSSDATPHFMTFSTAILRRFGMNGHTQAARPAPTSYACLWTKFIICIIPNYAVRQRDTKSLFALA